MSCDQITITHPSGASAKVHPFGATVTSFKTAAGREKLFVSRIAKFDGSRPVRGGVPICFPQVRRPDERMPAHGFARCNFWKVGSSFEEDGAACHDFTLSLADVEKARGGKWAVGCDIDCKATLTVKVYPTRLVTEFKVLNNGNTDFDCQVLFHTYYAVDGHKALDTAATNVVGLAGYTVDDQVSKLQSTLCEKPIHLVDGLLDRIYSSTEKVDMDVTVNTGGPSFRLEASATVNGEPTPISMVIWNPHIDFAKQLTDLGDDQYHDMICVEPGVLNAPPLKIGNELVFQKTTTCTSD